MVTTNTVTKNSAMSIILPDYGKIVTTGKQIILNRGYLTTPTKTAPYYFKLSNSLTIPADADTGIGTLIPITNTSVDECDATTGWGQSADGIAPTVNTSTKKSGTGSLNLGKSGTASVNADYTKTTFASFNGTGYTVLAWVYIVDATALAKIANIELRVGSDASNYYYKTYAMASLATGWNSLRVILGVDTAVGTPVIASTDSGVLHIQTNLTTDLFTLGDIIMDQWHRANDSNFRKQITDGGSVVTNDITKSATITCYLNSLEANGYNITKVGVYNQDTTNVLFSEDLHTVVSKSSSDQIIYTLNHQEL